ncbi:type II toxin-antitoxin system PemK/MazF family toxin [Rickettsiales endosymbiont of Stachyamoeba lipophora]|uniref:type II toxin-antitoxin system PemK/MazF family toxin n=1 Tax=Rickettsiales endosymbiont of Stachyamoeba lipophora TaxID=2486578 RepID=UPI0019D1EB13|nr:type II toxin-antitoxin system PemK/MazF family toxin [Rickettsiales endosymbiont of Stachyamoeba lipophora]
MVTAYKQFAIFLANLDPTLGSEIKKTRPCVIISPDEMNKYLNTVIIAPLTSVARMYPTRVSCIFDNKKGQIALDQMRTVDKTRLVKIIGEVKNLESSMIKKTLIEMFS